MKFKIHLFAYLREALGETIELEVPEPVTSLRLIARFLERYPEYKDAEASLNLAVDQNYVTEDVPIRAGQELAIFPPVSGGRDAAGWSKPDRTGQITKRTRG